MDLVRFTEEINNEKLLCRVDIVKLFSFESIFSWSVLQKLMLQTQRLQGYDGSWSDFTIMQWPLYCSLSK